MDPSHILVLLVLALASYRITRFIVRDKLMGFAPDSDSVMSVRLDRFAYYREEEGKPLEDPDLEGLDRSWLRGRLGDLLTCVFCTGFWISLAVYCVWFRAWPWQLGVEGWVEVWAVAGIQSYVGSRMNA